MSERRSDGGGAISAAMRRDVQTSDESVRRIAARLGINAKTVQRWRHRSSIEDRAQAPRRPDRLSDIEQAMILVFRRVTLLPLDDCLYAMQPLIPTLTRVTLYRCLRRYGLARLPPHADLRPGAGYRHGWFRFDRVEVCTAEESFHLYIATDLFSKLLYTRIYATHQVNVIDDFLTSLAAAIPYRISAISTEVDRPEVVRVGGVLGMALVDLPAWLPWRETMPAVDEAVARARHDRDFYATNAGFFSHAENVASAYNLHRRMKLLRGMTPYQYIARAWREDRRLFTRDPSQDGLSGMLRPAARGETAGG